MAKEQDDPRLLTKEEMEVADFEFVDHSGYSIPILKAQLAKVDNHRLDRPELRENIIDSLHWKEYTFIGQGNAIFEGSLTQESEGQVADQILATLDINYVATQ